MQGSLSVYAGVFLISLVNLLFELLLVRIMSVTIRPHIAFLAISIAMCGMTIGSLAVLLAPAIFKKERTLFWLSTSCLLFSISLIITLWIHLQLKMPVEFKPTLYSPLSSMYALMSLPFIASGICICLALTRYSANVGKIYAADLCGAAFACFLLPALLRLADGVSAAIFIAALASFAGFAFAYANSRFLSISSLTLAVSLSCLCYANLDTQFLKINWIAGHKQAPVQFESWNSYSRVVIYKALSSIPYLWSPSSVMPPCRGKELNIEIDSGAGTTMPFFQGDLEPLSYLKYDVVNVGYYLTKAPKVLVIGVGGGRDVLAALLFGASKVTAVEVNDTIVRILNREYSHFNAVASDSRVKLHNEDARSFMTRIDDKFDFIQISLVDTLAATASGAWAFTENSIYTVEAWKLCIDRLSEKGIFSVSYWYHPIVETSFHRLVYMAARALQADNVANPRQHLIMISNREGKTRVATLLISRTPFSKEDIQKTREVANSLKYTVVFDPEQTADSKSARVVSQLNPDLEPQKGTWQFEPPRDDCPFPFNNLKLEKKNVFECPEGVSFLIALFFTSVGIFLPLAIMRQKFSIRRSVPFIAYFAAIGVGFIFFEISQMQRLSIFLGHPTLALSVVLGTLLLASGLGSYFLERGNLKAFNERPTMVPASIAAVLLLYYILAPLVLAVFGGCDTFTRSVVAILIMAPSGFCMGMAMPLGLREALSQEQEAIPWMWGINGAASVLGSVVAIVIAMNFSISLVLELAIACYLVAIGSACLWGLNKASAS